jgi:quinol monooxygenase YgiN
MSKIAVIAKIVAKPGKRDEVAKVMGSLVDPVGDEAGTEIYAMHEDLGNPDVLWFYELYTDGDALSVHGTSEALASSFGKISDSVAEKPEIILLNPVTAKGLAL